MRRNVNALLSLLLHAFDIAMSPQFVTRISYNDQPAASTTTFRVRVNGLVMFLVIL